MPDDSISPATRQLIHISELPGIGVVALRKAVHHAYKHGLDSIAEDTVVLRLFAQRASKFSKAKRSVLEKCHRYGIRVLSPLDDEYPKVLFQIRDFPPLLYVKGHVQALMKTGCAVVGTRDASHLGRCWARKIALFLADKDVSIVSGLALGIDTAVHEGALEAQGVTVAVLAHGPEQITPRRNQKLAWRILDRGGALIAEHPPEVPPKRHQYVQRNRIQSGMSACSIVVESGASGGTIHHGRFAYEQRRALFCIQPEPTVEGFHAFQSNGAELLIREYQAQGIRTGEDLDCLVAQGHLPQHGEESRFQVGDASRNMHQDRLL